MLDYTTCCKLKAAGYPQSVAPWAMYIAPNGTEYANATPYWASRPGNDGVICPSSDELIAAIQQRWRDRGEIGLTEFRNSTEPLEDFWEALLEGEGFTWQGTGNTPAEALAALYLALAGGE